MPRTKNIRKEYDILRGIAIISVVLGHIAIHFSHVKWLYFLHKVGIQFQLPVFFFVSGSLFAYSVRKKKSTVFRKKISRILIPYLIFGTLCFLFKSAYISLSTNAYYFEFSKLLYSLFTASANLLVVDGTGIGVGPSWFLLIIFICILIKLLTLWMPTLLEGCLLGIILYTFPFVPEQIHISVDRLAYSYLFFSLGFHLSGFEVWKNSLRDNSFLKWIWLPVSGICILNILTFYGPLSNHNIVLTLLWIITLYGLATHKKGKNQLLEMIGKNTMPIYLLHAPYFLGLSLLVLSKIAMPDAMRIFLIFAICLLGPIGMGRCYTAAQNKLFDGKKITN